MTPRYRAMGEGVHNSEPSWGTGKMMVSWTVMARSLSDFDPFSDPNFLAMTAVKLQQTVFNLMSKY